VTFTPKATGPRTAQVNITSNGSNSPLEISLTGTGLAPGPPLSVTSLAFGSQGVGFTSAPQSVTVTNSGTSALNITSIAITGTNSADFAQTNTCATSVAAGRSCVISVTFTPKATGTRTASINVSDNASGSPQTISLTGTGIAGYTTVDYPVGGFPVGWPTGGSSEPKGVVFDGTNIWVANFFTNNVTKLLASTGAILGTYSVGANNYPVGLAFDGSNIWVTNQGSNTVTKLLASTGAIVGIYPVGSEPEGIAFDGTNIWVANYGSVFVPPGTNDVTKLRASTGATVGAYGGAPYPVGVAFDGTNIWVTSKRINTVTKLLASMGGDLGSFYVGTDPEGVVFDGVNIWVVNKGSNTVTKLLASTGALVGTYAVGSKPQGIAFDGVNIWVANSGSSTVTQLLASTGTLVSTYPVGSQPSGVIGPDSSDVANPESVAFDGTNIWVTNFYSGTVTKISPTSQAPSISPGGIVPLDSTKSTIQPGEWVSIWGRNLASGTTIWSGDFPTSLGGTSVRINGRAAYLSFVSPGQINLQAPDDAATGTVPVVVTTANGSTTSTVTLGEFAPSFALFDSKHVAGIIPRSDGSGAYGGGTYDLLGPTGSSLGYPTVAAKAGDSVELYGVGFGPTNPSVPAGQAFSGAAATTNTVQLAIGGKTVLPSFSGLSEAGLFQINVTIPAGLGTGDLPLVGNVGGVQTQTGVVISLQ
jgi:uncharacterized protein (TIGR03437 family)